MSTFWRLNAASVNIRNGPTSGALDIGDLVRDDVVEVVEKSGNWSRIVDAQHSDGSPVLLSGGRGPVSAYAANQCWATNAYFLSVAGMPSQPPPPPPPPPPPQDPVLPDVLYIATKEDMTDRKKFVRS